MRSEHTVLIVGCQPGVERILSSALQRCGCRVHTSDFYGIVSYAKAPDCVIIDLDEGDCLAARKFLEQPIFACSRRILIIDSHSSRLRQWSIDIPIDDVIFKPICLRELLARVQLILDREVCVPGQENTVDELDFAQRMQDLSDGRFTGLVHYDAAKGGADLYFVRGTIAGVRVGRKIQKTAVSAIWRVFPAVHHVKPKVRLPDWALENPLECDLNQFMATVVRTGAFFHDIFGDVKQLRAIYRINSLEYERVYRDLPRQVRQIIQHFDGERSFGAILDALNLDEMLLMQIVRRLLDESLIVPFEHEESGRSDVPLKSWIQSGAGSAEIRRALNSSANVLHVDDELDDRKPFSSVYRPEGDEYRPGEDATPSAVFFLQNSPQEVHKTRAHEPSVNSESAKKESAGAAKSEGAKPAKKTSGTSSHAGQTEQDRIRAQKEAILRAQKEAILADFSQRTGIARRDVRLTPHASGVFNAQPVALKHYSREAVEAHLAESDERMQTSNCSVHEDTVYSTRMLEKEAVRDEERARQQQAEDEAVLNLSIDDSEINEALACETPDAPEEDEEYEEEEEEAFSSVKLYKNDPDHKYELAPDVWKAQLMKRFKADEDKRDARMMRLLIGIIIGFALLFAGIVAYKMMTKEAAVPAILDGTESTRTQGAP